MKYKEQIIKLSEERDKFFNDSAENDVDENGNTIIEPGDLDDQLGRKILDLIKKGFHKLEFEFIFEQLSKLGQAPCLLYDDNGHWAVTGDGYASISLNIDDWEGSFFVEAKKWKETPRKALEYYLFNEEE